LRVAGRGENEDGKSQNPAVSQNLFH
jgi:hypothetical protein